MSKVTICIPSRNERFLPETVNDIFNKARGDIEVIVNLDGYWPNPPLQDRKNLHIIHRGIPKGLRTGVNSATAIAKGDYFLKCDAHCMFSEGFDEVLKNDYEDKTITILRRYSLDPETWTRRDKGPIDYHYLDCPMTNPEYFQFHGVVWNERRSERQDPKYDIDETLSFQGSMWFMSREHWNWLGNMSEEGYGTFSQEPQEIGNKTWLGGGKLITNKKAWYAHLHKGKQYGRMYNMNMNEVKKGHIYSATYWMNNSWKERKYDIEWLIERFMPLPNWPTNWKELLENWRKEQHDKGMS